MRANRGIPSDLEKDSKHLEKGQSAFRRKGDVMVQVWKDKRHASDEYDPWRNSCKHREERQENKHGNKEALCCYPVQ